MRLVLREWVPKIGELKELIVDSINGSGLSQFMKVDVPEGNCEPGL